MAGSLNNHAIFIQILDHGRAGIRVPRRHVQESVLRIVCGASNSFGCWVVGRKGVVERADKPSRAPVSTSSRICAQGRGSACCRDIKVEKVACTASLSSENEVDVDIWCMKVGWEVFVCECKMAVV